MKKILSILLIMVMTMPLVVKADAEHIYTYYNDNVVEGGEVEIHIPVLNDKEYNLTINYDSSLLKTDDSMITINPKTYLTLENGDDPDEKNNLKEVNVENGTITLKAKLNNSCCAIGDSPKPEINVRFTAIKEGEATIEINSASLGDLIDNPKIKISKSTQGNDNTEVTTIGATNDTKESKNDNTFFYGSLIVNVLQLIAIIILIVVSKKKNKTV